MNLVFVTEARFIRNRFGIYGDSTYSTRLWNRYLQVFEKIYVLARVKNDEHFIGNDKYLSSKENVEFLEVPYYIGIKEFFIIRKEIKSFIKQVINRHKNESFICRVPGTLGRIAAKELINIKKKYALEIVGDPWEVFAPNAVKIPIRPLIRIISYLSLKKTTKNATAVLYVTESTLQQRYPAIKAEYITSASNVMLEDEQISTEPKNWQKKDQYHVISIGSLSQLYKAPDIVIKTISELHKKGLKYKLTWLGDGLYMEEMRQLVARLGLNSYVTFKGNVDNKQVQILLQQHDLFVLASRTEGLPRAMIEAMAQGLPCIGTNVGGIPELIDKSSLVRKNSVKELSNKIKDILEDNSLYNYQAMRNIEEAKKYRESLLSKKRNDFYQYIVKHS